MILEAYILYQKALGLSDPQILYRLAGDYSIDISPIQYQERLVYLNVFEIAHIIQRYKKDPGSFGLIFCIDGFINVKCKKVIF